MTILAELYAAPWAVRPEVLSAVLRYVERRDISPDVLARAFHFDPAVQEAARQQRWNRYAVHQQTSVLVDGSQALYRRGQTAILPITGPIIRRGNLMSSLSGGPMTSVELLAKDLTRALEDPAFSAVLLDVDSPGGEASGIAELAQIIVDGRLEKRITAYVGDLAASAAYWLASAASEVVVNRTAAVGSIGVVMAVPDPKASEDGYVEFVSSVSPNKRPDPRSKDGRQQLQDLVDTLGQLFVDDVAANRAVSRETVLSDFGGGGLRVGQDAVERRMADRLGSFEEVLASLAPTVVPGRQAGRSPARRVAPDGPADDAAPTPLHEDRPRSPAAAISASIDLARPLADAGGAMSSLLENLRQLVATAEAPASADREALVVAQHAGTGTGTSWTGTSASATVAGGRSDHDHTERLVPPTPVTDGDATLRQRLIAAEAENARLKFAQIQARADAFARAQTDAVRALPPEVPHLVALYCVLASDDETHGPIQLGQGKTTNRVAYLENALAARPSRSELTEDLLGDTVKHVLTERSRPRSDPDAPITPERLAELLGHTTVGRAVLADSVSAGRGK